VGYGFIMNLRFTNNQANKFLFPILFFIGFLLLIFSILRYNFWDHTELKFIGGLGLTLAILGIDFYLKSNYTKIGLIGFLISAFSLSFFYFVALQETNFLAFLYSGGIALMISDIFMNNTTSKFYSEIKNQLGSIQELVNSCVNREIESPENIDNLVDLSFDVWRMEKRIHSMKTVLDENQINLFETTIERMKRALGKNNIEIVDFTNQRYIPGQNIDVLASEKDPQISFSIIRETIEPTILYNGKVIKRGKVIVLEKE